MHKNLVLTQTVGNTTILTLNRPERHNSLIPPLLDALLAEVETVSRQQETRAMVIQANGKSFSTGGDLQGFLDHIDNLEEYADQLVESLNRVILAILEIPIPVIAAVQGLVTGGSMGLVLASDIVLVTSQASFTPYYSEVGFSPDGGWTAILPEIIGRKRAAQILMCNLPISAQQAVDLGLASRIVESKTLHDEAHRIANQIASAQLGSIKHIKQLLGIPKSVIAARLAEEKARFISLVNVPATRKSMSDFYKRMRTEKLGDPHVPF